MPKLILLSGDVGGVGKSMVCHTFAQYLLDRKHPFKLFDSDRTNPDIALIFKENCHLAIFSEGNQFQEAANSLYNSAAQQDVVVNCPAQVSPALNNWLLSNEILSFAEEDGIKLWYWFVTDGKVDSLRILQRSLIHFGGSLSHLVVKNWGINEDWQLLDNNTELQQLFRAHQVQVINFPKLHSIADCQRIDRLSLTFGEARIYQDFSLITRNRIRSFLRKAYAEFDRIFPT